MAYRQLQTLTLGTISASLNDVEVCLSTAIVLAQQTADAALPLGIPSSQPSPAQFVTRPSKLMVICTVEYGLGTQEHGLSTDQIAKTLQQPELWQQLRWKCTSCHTSRRGYLVDIIELQFENSDSTGSHGRRRVHRIDEGVPSYDVRPPQGYSATQLESVKCSIRLGQVADNQLKEPGCEDEGDTGTALSSIERLSIYSSSPLLQVADSDAFDKPHGHTPIEHGDEMLDLSSSPRPRLLEDDSSFLNPASEMTLLSSSPPVLSELALLSPALKNVELCSGLAAMLRAALHTSTRREPRFTYSHDFTSMSDVAPSTFMPGFMEAIASRAPHISRMTSSLAAFDNDTAPALDIDDMDTSNLSPTLQHSLWNLGVHHLTTQCSKIRLQATTLQLASIDQRLNSDDYALIDGASECDSDCSSDSDLLDCNKLLHSHAEMI